MSKLIYVNILGKNADDENVYEFYFTDEIEFVWQTDWDVKPSSICNIKPPPKMCYTNINILKTKIVLDLAQKNSCFSMQDCKDKIIPVAWENLDDYTEYPEDGRIVFHFGLDLAKIEVILAKRNITFE